MNILDIAIIAFIIMEFSNVVILYFFPSFKYGNGVAIFNNLTPFVKDKNLELFARYMINWVAGTKLIFIVLLVVILFDGNETTKVYALIVMIFSIATYFLGLHPIIKKLDENNMINPKGYSKTLLIMITSIIIVFTIALITYLIT